MGQADANSCSWPGWDLPRAHSFLRKQPPDRSAIPSQRPLCRTRARAFNQRAADVLIKHVVRQDYYPRCRVRVGKRGSELGLGDGVMERFRFLCKIGRIFASFIFAELRPNARILFITTTLTLNNNKKITSTDETPIGKFEKIDTHTC